MLIEQCPVFFSRPDVVSISLWFVILKVDRFEDAGKSWLPKSALFSHLDVTAPRGFLNHRGLVACLAVSECYTPSGVQAANLRTCEQVTYH